MLSGWLALQFVKVIKVSGLFRSENTKLLVRVFIKIGAKQKLTVWKVVTCFAASSVMGTSSSGIGELPVAISNLSYLTILPSSSSIYFLDGEKSYLILCCKLIVKNQSKEI